MAFDGEFGSGDPIEEPKLDPSQPEDDGNLADLFLGVRAPAGANKGGKQDATPQGQGQGESQTPAPVQGQQNAAAPAQPSAQPNGQAQTAGPFQMPQDLWLQYQHFLASQQPAAPYPAQPMPTPGYAGGYPPGLAVQPYPGYTPVAPPQVPAWQPALQSTPAAPPQQPQGQEPDVDDNEWVEKFYQAPRKVLAQEIERRAAQLATKIIEQRESQFGQVLGPLLQNMQSRLESLQTALAQREWQDRMLSELEALQAQDPQNFERVAPHMQAVWREDPRLLQGLRTGQLSLRVIYALAAQRAGASQPAQPAQPDPKQVARMPQSPGPRVLNDQAEPDNDTLVTAFLGPAEGRGEFE